MAADARRHARPAAASRPSKWGGLPLTLILAANGIVFSFPLAVLLALGRRSELPVIRALSVGYIEIVRGVPLITVLFMASLMIPLFLPEGITIDKLLRAQIGFILFAAAYEAEVIRGGLQAMPKGQYEAADALGLSYWQKMGFIVLPQALKVVIPPMVNTFIGFFKDTSLVIIIGLFDLLGAVRLASSDVEWRHVLRRGPGVRRARLLRVLLRDGRPTAGASKRALTRRRDGRAQMRQREVVRTVRVRAGTRTCGFRTLHRA